MRIGENIVGLDMYLEQDIYIGGHWEHHNVSGIILIRRGEKQKKIKIDPKMVSKVTLHMGYWRKANHIHKWFVDNVQGGKDECIRHWVDPDALKSLKDLCLQVLENHSLAKELLPTCSGFFFGNEEYDHYYFEDVQLTVDIINKCLESKYELSDFYYQSSW